MIYPNDEPQDSYLHLADPGSLCASKHCGNCMFAVTFPLMDSTLECRFLPPVGAGLKAAWPYVDRGNVCGQWKNYDDEMRRKG